MMCSKLFCGRVSCLAQCSLFYCSHYMLQQFRITLSSTLWSDSPDVLNLFVLLTQAVLKVAPELRQSGVGSVKTCLGVTQSLIGIVELSSQPVTVSLQLVTDSHQLLHLSTQVLVLALSLAQPVYSTSTHR